MWACREETKNNGTNEKGYRFDFTVFSRCDALAKGIQSGFIITLGFRVSKKKKKLFPKSPLNNIIYICVFYVGTYTNIHIKYIRKSTEGRGGGMRRFSCGGRVGVYNIRTRT